MKVKIIVRRELCQSAATCVAMAPDIYALDDEFKAVVKDEKPEQDTEFIMDVDEKKLKSVLDGAKACPYNAIEVYDTQTGKKLYPLQ